MLSVKIAANRIVTLALVSLAIATSAHADVSKYCSAELSRFCSSSRAHSKPLICLQRHARDLGSDCATYLTRLDAAFELTSNFEAACGNSFHSWCGPGQFKVGKVKSCIGEHRNAASKMCNEAYDKYFTDLKKISHQSPEELRLLTSSAKNPSGKYRFLASGNTYMSGGRSYRSDYGRTMRASYQSKAAAPHLDRPKVGFLKRSRQQMNAIITKAMKKLGIKESNEG